MTPDFALNLSQEGIALYVRDAKAWRVVGTVSLDSKMLAGDLAALRGKAKAVGNKEFVTKLILPNSQIFYTQVAAGSTSDANEARVIEALEGATPYKVDDLVFDWEQEAETLRIAAVAKQTLGEAEGFANEHGFNPVCFTTIPASDDFDREPFFGATSCAAQYVDDFAAVAGDKHPVSLTPVEEVIAAPAPVEPEPPEPLATQPAAPKIEDQPDAPAAPAKGAERDAALTRQVDAPVASEAYDDPAPAVEEPPQQIKPIGFSSIRARSEPPTTQQTPAPVAEKPAAEAAPVMPKLGGARRELGVNSPQIDVPPATGTTVTPSKTPPRTPKAKKPVVVSAKPVDAPAPTKKKRAAAAVVPKVQIAPRPADPTQSEDATEEDRLTIFGQRSERSRVRETPRYFGLVLTAILLVFLLLVALWASLTPGSNIANALWGDERATDTSSLTASGGGTLGTEQPRTRSIVFGEVGGPETTQTTEQPNHDVATSLGVEPQTPQPNVDGVDLATLGSAPFASDERPALPGLSEPVLETPPLPEIDAEPEPEPEELADREPTAMDEDEALSAYAASGIWQKAPVAAATPPDDDLSSLYLTSIDPNVTILDAVALPRTTLNADRALPRQALPLPPGETVVLGPDGKVAPTPEGAITAEGVTLFAGRPNLVPPQRPRETPTPEGAPDTLPALAKKPPKQRPANLAEEAEKAELGGRTRVELAGLRPRSRPQSVQQAAEAARKEAIALALKQAEEEKKKAAEEAAAKAEEENKSAVEDALKTAQSEEEKRKAAEAAAKAQKEAEFRSASRLAVAKSREPKRRPRNLAAKAARAQKNAANDANPEVRTNAAAVSRSQRVQPKVPTAASVAKHATVRNAIRLGRVNLIGVYGSPSKRRALVRLPNGRYVKVKVGDRVDGGKVSAIGEKELRYSKGGRNVVLKMPKG